MKKRPLPDDLISKEKALDLLFSNWTPKIESEEIPLDQAKGRTLAQELKAKYNLPVVRASRMDGVAVKSQAFCNGKADTTSWVYGVDYVRADTGDDFDDAFDSVIPIEDVILKDGQISLSEDLEFQPGMCVKPCGADLTEGTLLAEEGEVLSARSLSLIAMGGYDKVLVYKKIKVAFIPTGSELVKAGSQLKRGQNFDSNSFLVKELIEEYGAKALLHPIVADEPQAISKAFDQVFDQADVIIINAGTSKGSEDYSAKLLEERGEVLFHGVAAVPGRPMSMAVIENKPVLNISGPAFAAFYSMDWAVKAIITKAMKTNIPQRVKVQATLSQDFMTPVPLSACSAMEVVQQEDGSYIASPVKLMGPGARGIVGAMRANALYISKRGEKGYKAGDTIIVEMI